MQARIQNLKIAEEAIQYVKENYPLGGINQLDVVLSLPEETVEEQVKIITLFRSIKNQADLSEHRNTFNKLKSGRCGEFAAFALTYVKTNYPESLPEIVSLENHQCIVIGRAKNSDPTDISTWGPDAVICDPWAKRFYPALEFSEKQKTLPNILFFKFSPFLPQNLASKHYLAGNPRIGL